MRGSEVDNKWRRQGALASVARRSFPFDWNRAMRFEASFFKNWTNVQWAVANIGCLNPAQDFCQALPDFDISDLVLASLKIQGTDSLNLLWYE